MIITWFAFLFIALLFAISFAVSLRQIIRRRRRTQLRLLRDRRRKLGQEMSAQLEKLKCIDIAKLNSFREKAENTLEHLQSDTNARRIFLKNYEDLAFLQKHFITTLQNELKTVRSQEIESDRVTNIEFTPNPREVRNRAEDALLNQIKKIQQPKKNSPDN
tara:strand:- start:1128 stop:1610 length:483 start_codon:yes stop_codon:yes gene_type:complete